MEHQNTNLIITTFHCYINRQSSQLLVWVIIECQKWYISLVTLMLVIYTQYVGLRHIIDVEKFTGLNICSFKPIKVFTEILLCCLGQKCSLFSYKEEILFTAKLSQYSWKPWKFIPVNISMFTVHTRQIPCAHVPLHKVITSMLPL